MNKMAMVLVSVVALTGCAGNQAGMHTPADVEVSKAPIRKQPDNFDKAGAVVADSTRFVWEGAAYAWKWLDTDEHKQELRHAGQVIKAAAVNAWDGAKEELDKH
jgi:hypothetical protein